VSIWRRIQERLWTGPTLQDFGIVAEGRYGAAHRTVTALLAHRDGHDRFVIKGSYRAFLSASDSFLDFDRDAATKLRAALDEALAVMDERASEAGTK
jgi:hypothetical protein